MNKRNSSVCLVLYMRHRESLGKAPLQHCTPLYYKGHTLSNVRHVDKLQMNKVDRQECVGMIMRESRPTMKSVPLVCRCAVAVASAEPNSQCVRGAEHVLNCLQALNAVDE